MPFSNLILSSSIKSNRNKHDEGAQSVFITNLLPILYMKVHSKVRFIGREGSSMKPWARVMTQIQNRLSKSCNP